MTEGTKEVVPTTTEDVAAGVEAMRAEIEASIAENGCPEFIRPLYEAAEWFSARLRDLGATDGEAEAASFALGQRVCAAGGARNAYREAAAAFDRFCAGRRDVPGLDLANRLIDGEEP